MAYFSLNCRFRVHFVYFSRTEVWESWVVINSSGLFIYMSSSKQYSLSLISDLDMKLYRIYNLLKYLKRLWKKEKDEGNSEKWRVWVQSGGDREGPGSHWKQSDRWQEQLKGEFPRQQGMCAGGEGDKFVITSFDSSANADSFTWRLPRWRG